MDSFFVTPQIGLSGNLAIYDWPAPDSPPRGRVLLVHGLGEHMGRYAHVAAQLNAWRFTVRGYADNAMDAKRDNLVPIGLVAGAKIIKPIGVGELLTYEIGRAHV